MVYQQVSRVALLNAVVQSQGRQANRNGRVFEDLIAQRLRSEGYVSLTKLPDKFEFPFFVAQLRGRFSSIYGSPLRVDFFVWHPEKYPNGMIIECKYQETAGSADEKFPYTVANLRKANIPAVLLIMGRGPKPCSVEWCLKQQDEHLKVFKDLESFMKSTNRDLF